MYSHYVINVAKSVSGQGIGPSGWSDYRHFFRTGETLANLADAVAVHAELREAFPSPAYLLTVTHWRAEGTDMTPSPGHSLTVPGHVV